MPSKKNPAAVGMTEMPSIPKEPIEQLTGGATPMTADQITATTMALIVRALDAELSRHLVYPPDSTAPRRPQTSVTASLPRPCWSIPCARPNVKANCASA